MSKTNKRRLLTNEEYWARQKARKATLFTILWIAAYIIFISSIMYFTL